MSHYTKQGCTKKQSYLYTNIHQHVVHLFNLRQGVCEQVGDDNVVRIFISKVGHQLITVHQL